MPPRRCLPSWLGRQLHANGGGGLTGVGLMVAQRVFLARALPGPGKGLAVAPAVIPGKALAGGLVVLFGWDPAKDHHLLKGVSDLECLHKDLHAATQVPAQLVGSAAACMRWWRFSRRGPDGGPVGVLGKGLAGAPARVLPRHLLSSPARRLPGVLWSSSAGIPPRVVISLVRI